MSEKSTPTNINTIKKRRRPSKSMIADIARNLVECVNAYSVCNLEMAKNLSKFQWRIFINRLREKTTKNRLH